MSLEQTTQAICSVMVLALCRHNEAVFLCLKAYDSGVYAVKIGEMQFNAGTKAILLRITGLLSQYTKVDVD